MTSTSWAWIVGSACVVSTLAAVGDETALRERLQASMPHLTISRIAPSAVAGIREVEVEERGAMFYVAEDGSHLVAGDMYALTEDGLANVSEVRRGERRRELLGALDPGSAIVFAPDEEARAVVHVFTDVDCPHCREFHRQIGEMNGYGIEVRYLAYPLSGAFAEIGGKMAAAWCAEDPRAALTTLKSGGEIEPATCADPVAQHVSLGEKLHVEGTPTVVTESGERIPGYLPAADLAERLGVDIR